MRRRSPSALSPRSDAFPVQQLLISPSLCFGLSQTFRCTHQPTAQRSLILFRVDEAVGLEGGQELLVSREGHADVVLHELRKPTCLGRRCVRTRGRIVRNVGADCSPVECLVRGHGDAGTNPENPPGMFASL